MKNYLSLFKNKNFIALWVSQFLSQIAIHSLTFLIILKVFDSTGSTIATSLVWVIFVLPAIILGPFASTFVDMVDRRKVLILSNLVQALIILAYSFTEKNSLYLSYAIVLMYSIFNQFYIPAELSALPYVVKKNNLSRANGLFLITYQAALVVGFGISGVIIETLGFHKAFLFASLFVFTAFLSVLSLPKMLAEEVIDLKKIKFDEIFKRLFEGVNFIKNDRVVLLPFLAIIGLQVTLPIVVVNLPIISQDILGLSPHLSGITITTPAGFGAFLGIVAASKRMEEYGVKRAIKESLFVLTVSFWGLLLLVPLLNMPYKMIISTVLFIMTGASFIVIFITAQTQLQLATPKKIMARVFGNSWFFTSLGTIIPMVFSATITEIVGIHALVGIIGVIILFVLIFYEKIVLVRL